MTARRNLLWLIPLVLFVTSPLWQPAVTDFLRPRGGFDSEAAQAVDKKQAFVMDRITITLDRSGRKEWKVEAERAFTGKTDRELDMVNVHAVYLDPDQPITIDSRRGTYLIDGRHLILRKKVVVRKPRAREELRTELLHYYDAIRMVISPVPVRITGPRFTLTAGRMDYDLSTDGYDFGGRVKVEL